MGLIFRIAHDDALSARFFFRLAEEYVFRLLREMIMRPNNLGDESIQTVQATVLIHALQINSNHNGVRLRVRVNRFPEIVAAMRHLDLFSAVRGERLEAENWERFVADETRFRYGNDFSPRLKR